MSIAVGLYSNQDEDILVQMTNVKGQEILSRQNETRRDLISVLLKSLTQFASIKQAYSTKYNFKAK